MEVLPQVKIGNESSETEVKERLLGNISFINFAVSSDYEIFIDHYASHEHVERANNLRHKDILYGGNAGVVEISGEKSIVVRFKSGYTAYDSSDNEKRTSEIRIISSVLENYLGEFLS